LIHAQKPLSNNFALKGSYNFFVFLFFHVILQSIKNTLGVPTDLLVARWFRMRELSKSNEYPHLVLLQFILKLNCNTMKKTNQIQIKFFKEESIFNQIDSESLELYCKIMSDRYGSLNDQEE